MRATYITLFLAAIFVARTAQPLFAQEVGTKIEIFYGNFEGKDVRVKILRVNEVEKEEFLIQVSGVDDPINNIIYKYKKEWQNADKRLNRYLYATRDIPGHAHYALFHSENTNHQVYKVFLINMPMKPILVEPSGYDENLDPVFMYNQYIDQQQTLKEKH
ncbi:hypothetical protein [Pseudochryseolinea flava]|uniref:Uncharacterized protein n=1 Tax=Pseudochryseolinea flava TaxID=2059302 RepID=A0A364Y5E1_9BACT|nr:hypothetical protein [Pseudochryseolinea flava]RAW02218.1 hypothetical protein DQQ10_06660 [Pseudochryseolinea flava]